MYYNPLFPIALLSGVLLFALGRVVSSRLTARKWWGLVLAIAILLCLPGLSFLVYYLHLFDDQLWYIQFRSLPGMELLAMAWGFLFGFMPVPTKSIPLFFCAPHVGVISAWPFVWYRCHSSSQRCYP